MFLQPYTTDDLKQSLGLQIEFTNDYLLFKIILLAVSHFCMSTELRFMAAYDDAQKSHHKSLDLLRHFVPDISPLRIHIEESYKKRFGDNEIITKTADSFNQRQRHPSQLPSIIERPESLSPRLIDIKSKNFSKTLRPKSVMGKTKIIVPWITDFNKKKNLTLKPSVLRRKDSHEETKVSTSARLD